MSKRKVSAPFFFSLMSILMLISFTANLTLGSVEIPLKSIGNILLGIGVEKESWKNIVLNSRLPGAIISLMAGSGLAVSGLLMQTLFRNPVAGPFILGISSGASLGVALLIFVVQGIGLGVIAQNAFLSNWSLIFASATGSLLVFLLIIFVSYRVRDITVLLIIGLMFGSLTGALISILQSFTSQVGLQAYVFWTFGSFKNITMQQVEILLPFLLACFVLSVYLIKPLNLLLLGEDYAKSLGTNFIKIRMLIVLCAGLLAGSVTAFCGPIAFIGLAIPHIVRALLATSDHKLLLPGSLITGAVIACICNILASLPGLDFALPINAVTSLLGAPIVIWVIVKRQEFSRNF